MANVSNIPAFTSRSNAGRGSAAHTSVDIAKAMATHTGARRMKPALLRGRRNVVLGGSGVAIVIRWIRPATPIIPTTRSALNSRGRLGLVDPSDYGPVG